MLHDFATMELSRLCDYATTMENREKSRAIRNGRPILWEFSVKKRSIWQKTDKFGIFWDFSVKIALFFRCRYVI